MLAQSGERQRSGKRRLREGKCGRQRTGVAREGFLDRRSKRCFWLLLSPQTKVARAGARNYPRRRQIMRLRRRGGELAFPWRGGGLRRPHFFLRRKKCGKESRLDLRSKDPLARYGSCKIGGADLAELVRRVSLSVKRTVPAFTGAEASATACLSHGRGICFYRVGDYQIAPIAARSTAMGRWRLTPPGYGGTCLPAGRSAGLTGHRRVIQHREHPGGKLEGAAGVQRKFTVFLQNLKVELRKASML